MNLCVVALNAALSSSLALRYLKHYCQPGFPIWDRFNINQEPMPFWQSWRQETGCSKFSCYIWNIELVLPLARNLRKVCPETTLSWAVLRFPLTWSTG